MNANELIEQLHLQPLPWEGGWYVETYRTPIDVPTTVLGGNYGGDSRQLSTAIYFLLTPDTVSRMHRVTSDEIFHFYLGDAVEQLRLHDDGTSEVVALGSDILNGQQVQTVVRGGVWQGARLINGGAFALMGTTVAPGFSFDDFELGKRAELALQFPDRAQMIEHLS